MLIGYAINTSQMNRAPVTRSSVNLNPIVQSISDFPVQINRPTDITLSATDPQNGSLEYALSKKPINGYALVGEKTNIAKYTPNYGFVGKDMFTYKAINKEKGTSSDEASVTITVGNPSENTATIVKEWNAKRIIQLYTLILIGLLVVVALVWLYYLVTLPSVIQATTPPIPLTTIPPNQTGATTTVPLISFNNQTGAIPLTTIPPNQTGATTTTVINHLDKISMYFISFVAIIGFLLFFNQKKLWDQIRVDQQVSALHHLTEKINNIQTGVNNKIDGIKSKMDDLKTTMDKWDKRTEST